MHCHVPFIRKSCHPAPTSLSNLSSLHCLHHHPGPGDHSSDRKNRQPGRVSSTPPTPQPAGILYISVRGFSHTNQRLPQLCCQPRRVADPICGPTGRPPLSILSVWSQCTDPSVISSQQGQRSITQKLVWAAGAAVSFIPVPQAWTRRCPPGEMQA